MKPQSRTPEGWPNRCPSCGAQLPIDASHTIDQHLECTGCYALISFVRLKGMIHAYSATRRNGSKLLEKERRELSKLVPEVVARQYQICPLCATPRFIAVLTSEAENEELLQKLELLFARKIKFFPAASKKQIDVLIERQYRQ